MALVRDIHREPGKQTLVRMTIAMCKELGIIVTSEGIETPDERNELARSGCDLMQGYLFARPGEPSRCRRSNDVVHVGFKRTMVLVSREVLDRAR